MNDQDHAITPGRLTTVTFDTPEQTCVNPRFDQEYRAPDIQAITQTNVEFLEGSGWVLKRITGDTDTVHEQNSASNNLITTYPSGFQSLSGFSDTSDIVGVNYSSATAPGDDLITKLVTASDNVTGSSYVLASDQAAVPTVTSYGPENVPMVRVGLGSGSPGKTYSDHFRFTIPGSRIDAKDNLYSYYFPGMVGMIANKGYYCAVFHGSGRLTLYGQDVGGNWHPLKETWFAAPADVAGSSFHIQIDVMQALAASEGVRYAGTIRIRSKIADRPTVGFTWPSMAAFAGGPQDPTGAFNFLYRVKAPATAGFGSEPRRVDMRPDLTGGFQASQAKFATNGTLRAQDFVLPFYVIGTGPFTFYPYGDMPDGTLVWCTVYDSTSGMALGSFSMNTTFTIPTTTSRRYYISFAFSGDGMTTPTLRGYWVSRGGLAYNVVPTPFSVQNASIDGKLRSSAATGFDIDQQTSDPKTATASFSVSDATESLATLHERGELPMTITTTDGAKTAMLFRGYAISPEANWMYSPPYRTSTEYGDMLAEYKINCTGMWHRLEERLTDCRIDLLNSADVDASGHTLPMKVTDIITMLFYYAGYDTSSLDIPDLPIRVFPLDTGSGLLLEPQTKIGELIQQLALDYFGGFIYADPGAGTFGTWRLFYQPNETPLVSFGSGLTPRASSLPQNINSFPADSHGLAQYPIYTHSRWSIKPPEGNYVVTYGAASGSGHSQSGLLCQIAYNLQSFDFKGTGTMPPRTGNYDYMSRPIPIYQYLPAYVNAGNIADPNSSINFVTRRVYDVACHGRKMMMFDAPLVLLDDPVTGIHRPLRFYDYVYVDGELSVICGVKMHWTRDLYQRATYTVMSLQGYNAPKPYPPGGPVLSLRKGFGRSIISKMGNGASESQFFNVERTTLNQFATIRGFDAVDVGTLQNADGSFPFMVGYDSLT